MRYEIVVNRSVEHDLIELLDQAKKGIHYSIFPQVFGRGRQGHRSGDAVWPETNISLVVYTEDETDGEAVIRAVRALKKLFPAEGIKLFAVPTSEIQL